MEAVGLNSSEHFMVAVRPQMSINAGGPRHVPHQHAGPLRQPGGTLQMPLLQQGGGGPRPPALEAMPLNSMNRAIFCKKIAESMVIGDTVVEAASVCDHIHPRGSGRELYRFIDRSGSRGVPMGTVIKWWVLSIRKFRAARHMENFYPSPLFLEQRGSEQQYLFRKPSADLCTIFNHLNNLQAGVSPVVETYRISHGNHDEAFSLLSTGLEQLEKRFAMEAEAHQANKRQQRLQSQLEGVYEQKEEGNTQEPSLGAAAGMQLSRPCLYHITRRPQRSLKMAVNVKGYTSLPSTWLKQPFCPCWLIGRKHKSPEAQRSRECYWCSLPPNHPELLTTVAQVSGCHLRYYNDRREYAILRQPIANEEEMVKQLKRDKALISLLQQNFPFPCAWDLSPGSHGAADDVGRLDLIDVPFISQEWNDIQSRFFDDWPRGERQYELCRVQRIQNRAIYEGYFKKKLKMLAMNGPEHVNERILFHGTRACDPSVIYDHSGFDMRLASEGNYYGRGIYFAVSVSREFTNSSTPL